ncbi:amino acid permease [Thermogymnomonas acidicola]|uniref:Amino acid permease n=1 Tax=Thermogymnomonas acidicola TaxID=399579 RepID=A0AA37BSK9_9ARCH|nr:APC family permease [Thermogymnomonas acidicola]GGM79048.1 amino acid permease [Thermogymnomonas acidicola]
MKHLRRDQLTLRHAVSQATALNAPGGTIVLYVSGTAALLTSTFTSYPSGSYAIPLILLISLVIYGLMTFSMYEFSKELSSSGGYYTFVSRGLGQRAGFITALSYLSYQILSFTGFGILGFMGFVYDVFPSFGIQIPFPTFLWIPLSLVFIGVVSWLIYSGIRPSLQFVSYTIIVEVLFFIATSLALIYEFHARLSLVPFTPKPVGNDTLALATMMVYAIGTYVGIGGSIPIAEETRNPKRNVPLAILITIAVLGITIILSAYAQVISWGAQNMASFGGSQFPYPVIYIYQHDFGYISTALVAVLIILVLNSFFTATVSLGTNATRVVFSLAREHVFPERLSSIHAVTGSPTKAIVLVAVLASIITIGTGLAFEATSGTVNGLLNASVFLLILESPITYLVHILTNTSLYSFMRKEGKRVSILRHIVIPSVSTLTLVFAVVVAVYLDLSPPYIYGIYGAIAVILAILITTLVVSTKSRRKLELIGDFSL